MTGEGVEQFITAVREGREEYEREYRPEYERLKREREELDMKKKETAGGSGKGAEVDIGGLCHSMREEVEVPDNIRQAIFLRHPGDDEDMEEEVSFYWSIYLLIGQSHQNRPLILIDGDRSFIGCFSGGGQGAGGGEQGG